MKGLYESIVINEIFLKISHGKISLNTKQVDIINEVTQMANLVT